jgi:hypothetical protein
MAKNKTEMREAVYQDIKDTISQLQDKKKDFTHINSNYTNTVIVDEQVIKWVKEKRSDKVFMAYRMILQDLEKNPLAHSVNSKVWDTMNYWNMEDDVEDFKLDHAINIDITSCYAYTLRTERLISEKTLDILLSLDKQDRLPAVGMLAYNRRVFKYESGILVDIQQDKSPWCSIFFFIIYKVQQLFMELKDLSESYYIFHWVDGLFLFPDTPQMLLDAIEERISQEGYLLKYESCREFSFTRKGKVLGIDFKKGGEPKSYLIRDAYYEQHFNRIVRALHEMQSKPDFWVN